MINRRQFCFSLSTVLLLPRQIVVPQEDSIFQAKIYKNSRRKTMPYRLFVPQGYRKQNKYPLVLWLHGGAGRGNDNLKQITGGNTIGSHVWTEPQSQSRYACLVVAPQCPDDQFWATIEAARPTEYLQQVVELLSELQQTFSIDPARLYVTGQSLGGFGTWSIITEYPRMFAAAVPICGGGDQSAASKLTQMPIWAFHGERDEAVSVERSRKMIAAIRQAGGTPKFTEYKGEDHVIWDKVFREPDLLPWIFTQKTK